MNDNSEGKVCDESSSIGNKNSMNNEKTSEIVPINNAPGPSNPADVDSRSDLEKIGPEEPNVPSSDQVCLASPDVTGSAANVRKKGWPKGRKRRCLPKDAPKAPLSGYMLYMAEQRELLKQSENPPSFIELAKIVAQNWGSLPADQKEKFLIAAKADKERYEKEIKEYIQTDSYKKFLVEQQANLSVPVSMPAKITQQSGQNTAPNIVNPVANSFPKNIVKDAVSGSLPKVNICEKDIEELNFDNHSPLEIPIFTTKFLNHNKDRESQLRQLRKAINDYEEHNALLQKKIENQRNILDKQDKEMAELKKQTVALDQHLSKLRSELAKAFANTPAPCWTSPPTPENIDQYLASLHASLTASPPAQNRALQLNVQQLVTGLLLH